MMRSTLIVVLVCLGGTAHADPKAKDAIRAHLDGVATSQNERTGDAAMALVTDGAVVKAEGSDVRGALYGTDLLLIEHTVGAISLVVDDKTGVGWFQAPFTSVVSEELGHGEVGPEQTSQLRAGGILIRSKGAWMIEAMVYTRPLADKKLVQRTGVALATGERAITGDPKLAAAVAAWFPAGFAAGASKTIAQLIASGTAPSELATGAGALKLARSWDKLKLAPTRLDARIIVAGRVGFVTATVLMPKKSGKNAVELRLGAVVISDGATWRWVSLQFLAPD